MVMNCRDRDEGLAKEVLANLSVASHAVYNLL